MATGRWLLGPTNRPHYCRSGIVRMSSLRFRRSGPLHANHPSIGHGQRQRRPRPAQFLAAGAVRRGAARTTTTTGGRSRCDARGGEGEPGLTCPHPRLPSLLPGTSQASVGAARRACPRTHARGPPCRWRRQAPALLECWLLDVAALADRSDPTPNTAHSWCVRFYGV